MFKLIKKNLFVKMSGNKYIFAFMFGLSQGGHLPLSRTPLLARRPVDSSKPSSAGMLRKSTTRITSSSSHS